MSDLDAIEILENGADGSPVEAMQALIDSGTVWHLQGSYGRAASRGIAEGIYKEVKQ